MILKNPSDNVLYFTRGGREREGERERERESSCVDVHVLHTIIIYACTNVDYT